MGCFSLYYFKKVFGGVSGERGKMEVGGMMTESEWKDEGLPITESEWKDEDLPITESEWKGLPMELLLKIVSCVDDQTVITASGVCNGWRDVICLNHSRLCLSWCKNGMNNLVLSLAPKFTKLQALSLRQERAQLQDDAVEAVANFCHDLLDLDLSNSTRLTNRSLYALAHGCPSLTKLNISGCTSFSGSALAYMCGCCKNLKSLNLCGCRIAATDRDFEAIAYNCTQLQTLILGSDVAGITGVSGVLRLAHGCPNLRVLVFEKCTSMLGE